MQVSVEQSELVRLVVSSCERPLPAESTCGVLYATQDGEEGEGPLYSFPRQDSVLSSARGAFLTLRHLVTELTKSPPVRYWLSTTYPEHVCGHHSYEGLIINIRYCTLSTVLYLIGENVHHNFETVRTSYCLSLIRFRNNNMNLNMRAY